MRKTTTLVIVITLALGIMLTSSAVLSGASVVVFAQKNQTKTNVTPAGKQATKIINQTSIPANKTTTTIQKKTEPVGKVPLPSNQTKLSPPGSQAKLPPVSNKTTTPTGKATTTIINKISTPINVTSTNASTAAKQPPTSQLAGNKTAAKQQQQSAKPKPANNSSANPLAKVPVIGKIFG